LNQALREESRKGYENEQMRLEYVQELKRRFEDEKRAMEGELVRMHDSLRSERAKRVEAEAVEHALRAELQRATEAYRSHKISLPLSSRCTAHCCHQP
jgi:hypothetical protein